VLGYNVVMTRRRMRQTTKQEPPTLAMSIVAGWCGMRGLVTLAAALALPFDFPERDVILLSALGVVLGTLIIQGLTLGPLIRFLHFAPDTSWEKGLSDARADLLESALAELEGKESKAAAILRHVYTSEREIVRKGEHPREVSEMDELRRSIITAKRQKLAEMRRTDEIDDDIFHILEQELDWAELAASSPGQEQIVEG
jgi:CPA1 family monovalent cation:H+ antiporter